MVVKSILTLVVLSISAIQWVILVLTYMNVILNGLAMMKKLHFTVDMKCHHIL